MHHRIPAQLRNACATSALVAVLCAVGSEPVFAQADDEYESYADNYDICSGACVAVAIAGLVTVIATPPMLAMQLGYAMSKSHFPDGLAWFEIGLAIPWLVAGVAASSATPFGLLPASVGLWLFVHAFAVLSADHPEPPPEARRFPRPPRQPRWHAGIVPLPGMLSASFSVQL